MRGVRAGVSAFSSEAVQTLFSHLLLIGAHRQSLVTCRARLCKPYFAVASGELTKWHPSLTAATTPNFCQGAGVAPAHLAFIASSPVDTPWEAVLGGKAGESDLLRHTTGLNCAVS
jgi:hypothetical protein